MHYCVYVLLEAPDPIDLKGSVRAAIAPFSEHIVTAERKEYLNDTDLLRMQEHYKTEDPRELAGCIKDWHGYDGGLDSRGLYFWSTMNPIARWDWWRIGGRYDGYITGKRAESTDQGFNFDERHESEASNSLPVSDLLPWITHEYVGGNADSTDRTPYAILTPDGVWDSRYRPYPMKDELFQDWSRRAKAILETYKDCIAVCVDIHV